MEVVSDGETDGSHDGLELGTRLGPELGTAESSTVRCSDGVVLRIAE